jgi:hypothetical protein
MKDANAGMACGLRHSATVLKLSKSAPSAGVRVGRRQRHEVRDFDKPSPVVSTTSPILQSYKKNGKIPAEIQMMTGCMTDSVVEVCPLTKQRAGSTSTED